MWQRMRNLGVDGRFVLFFAMTMVATILGGGVLGGVISALRSGEALQLQAGPMFALAGARLILPALVAWLVPAAAVFAAAMAALRRKMAFPLAAQWAAIVTALVSVAFAAFALTDFGANPDGFGVAGLLALTFGAVAIVAAPLIAGLIYR